MDPDGIYEFVLKFVMQSLLPSRSVTLTSELLGTIEFGPADACNPEAVGRTLWRYMLGHYDVGTYMNDWDAKRMATSPGNATFVTVDCVRVLKIATTDVDMHRVREEGGNLYVTPVCFRVIPLGD